MNKVYFDWTHYTRTFNKKDIIADQGRLEIEVRDTDSIFDTLPNIFFRVLRRIPQTEHIGKIAPFEEHGFIHQNPIINADVHIWQRKLGTDFAPQQPDYIEIKAKFPPNIQKRFIKEWDNYNDALSML